MQPNVISKMISQIEVLIEGEHHDHLICLDCNHILNLKDDIIEKRQDEVVDSFGMKIHSHRLELYARCKIRHSVHDITKAYQL